MEEINGDEREERVTERAGVVARNDRCLRRIIGMHKSRHCEKAPACKIAGCYIEHHWMLHGAGRVFPLNEKSKTSNGGTLHLKTPREREGTYGKVLTTPVTDGARGREPEELTAKVRQWLTVKQADEAAESARDRPTVKQSEQATNSRNESPVEGRDPEELVTGWWESDNEDRHTTHEEEVYGQDPQEKEEDED